MTLHEDTPVQSKLLRSSITNDDLMASLEMMNTLAADLPSSQYSNNGLLWLTTNSPLKRSQTVHAKRNLKLDNPNSGPGLMLKTSPQQQSYNYPQQATLLSPTSEVMKKPPLPKFTLSPTSALAAQQSCFSMSIPVHGHTTHGNYGQKMGTVTVAVPSSHWHHPKSETKPLDQERKVFVRDIPLNEPTANPEPPVPPRMSVAGSPLQDVPPPLPVRKYKRNFSCNDFYGQQPFQARPQREDSGGQYCVAKARLSSTTQTSPKLYRTTLSTDSGVMMGSPSPPTDSGIGVSPPTHIRQQANVYGKVVLAKQECTDSVGKKHNNKVVEDEDEDSSDESASLCSSVLSVDSDSSGSHYDNVESTKVVGQSAPTADTVSLVSGMGNQGTPIPMIDEDGGDGDDEDEGSNSDSDELNLNSFSDEETVGPSEPKGPKSHKNLGLGRSKTFHAMNKDMTQLAVSGWIIIISIKSSGVCFILKLIYCRGMLFIFVSLLGDDGISRPES